MLTESGDFSTVAWAVLLTTVEGWYSRSFPVLPGFDPPEELLPAGAAVLVADVDPAGVLLVTVFVTDVVVVLPPEPPHAANATALSVATTVNVLATFADVLKPTFTIVTSLPG